MPLDEFTSSCHRCGRGFTQKSSLVRHEKRRACEQPPTIRRKVCQHCYTLKLQCDLRRPKCGRCQLSSRTCEYVSTKNAWMDRSRSSNPDTTTRSANDELSINPPNENLTNIRHGERLVRQNSDPGETTSHGWRAPILTISEQRKQELLGQSPEAAVPDAAVKHIMHFVIRVMSSWPHIMASGLTTRCPPMLHPNQLSKGIPAALSHNILLMKMWTEHDEGSRRLVQDAILYEIRRLLREYYSYHPGDLLAATQSLIILTTLLVLDNRNNPVLRHPLDAELLIEIWDVKARLARTGLYLQEEYNHTVPSWREWTFIESKRRATLALNHLEWAWSLLHGYPVLTCFELGPLPAPAPGFLWSAPDEAAWKALYDQWLLDWKEGSYKMAELFYIEPKGRLDRRSELWLSQADEFGMMLMAEVNATGASS